MMNDGSAVVRVLVLDDEPEYAQPNVDALRRRKYDVVQTMTVDETLEILRREGDSFRVLVLDMLMPGSGGPADREEFTNPVETGMRLHRTIRSKLNLIEVPIIFTSVVRDPNIRERIREEERKYRNKVSFLTKPFLPVDLIDRIKKVT
ncbi:MAG: response regulator transcription factor [Chloroflexi bacterium]|nr:response regulator transcription factor [Chloroflexota bacterium]